MTTQQIVLIGVGAYFVVGAFIAHGITALSMGVAGRFEPMAIAAFFAWPILILLRIMGPWVFAMPWLAAAGAMVGVAYLLLHAL